MQSSSFRKITAISRVIIFSFTTTTTAYLRLPLLFRLICEFGYPERNNRKRSNHVPLGSSPKRETTLPGGKLSVLRERVKLYSLSTQINDIERHVNDGTLGTLLKASLSTNSFKNFRSSCIMNMFFSYFQIKRFGKRTFFTGVTFLIQRTKN